jgi:phosphosulfolactate phosphohydrolase-like enzyme
MTFEKQPGFDPRLALASEGGSLLAGAVVLAGCLRNASAVAAAATSAARSVS